MMCEILLFFFVIFFNNLNIFVLEKWVLFCVFVFVFLDLWFIFDLCLFCFFVMWFGSILDFFFVVVLRVLCLGLDDDGFGLDGFLLLENFKVWFGNFLWLCIILVCCCWISFFVCENRKMINLDLVIIEKRRRFFFFSWWVWEKLCYFEVKFIWVWIFESWILSCIFYDLLVGFLRVMYLWNLFLCFFMNFVGSF